MEIKGYIKKIEKAVQVTDRMKKANLILETDRSSDYPQTICIEFINDSIDYLSQFKENDFVNIGLNLRGREWTNPEGQTKYFNSIQGWRIENLQAGNAAPGQTPPPADQFEPAQDLKDEDYDDLPF